MTIDFFFILFSVINVLVSLGVLFFSKRMTIPFATFILLGVFGIANIRVSYLMMAETLLLLIGWGYFCYRFKTLDFREKIFSVGFDRNKIHDKNAHVIGKCQAYYQKQLKYNNSTIVQSPLSLKGSTLCSGSSGSGKTYTILTLIQQDLFAGKSVVSFNFKGDRDSTNEIKSFVPEGVKVYELSWENCNFSYDPLKNLDEAGRVEAILGMRKWSLDGADEHYRTSTQLFIQKTLREFRYTEGNFLREYYKFLRRYNVQRELYDAYNTVMKLLELSITSNIGSIFSEENEPFTFDTTEQYVLIVSFTSSTKALATSITSLMLRDLMEVGTREPYSPDLCLYIDEFGSCESPLVVKDIIEKGRSCNINTLISMQDLNQLIINTNAPFLNSVLGTVNSYIVFAGCTKKTAEELSGTQIEDIDKLLMSLRKPMFHKPPTAIFISKYPIFERGGTEVYRFTPFTRKKSHHLFSSIFQNSQSQQKKNMVNYTQPKLKEPEPPVFDDSDIPVPQTFKVEDLDKYL